MNIMKTTKIISVILAAGMISAATVAANAADSTGSVDIAVESVEAVAGEQVIININANIPDPGVAGCEFALTYDPAVLTIESVKEGNISGGTGAASAELAANAELADTMISGSDYSCLDYSIHADKGEVDIMWCTGLEDQSYWLKGEGQFISVVATVNAEAAGSTEVGIESISRDGNGEIVFGYVDYTNNAEVKYAVNATGGTVTIGGEGTVTTSATETEPPIESSVTTGESLGDPTLIGDANCDNLVDIRDVTYVNQYVIGIADFSSEALANSDVIVDGVVDIKDLGQLKKFMINLVDKL